MKMSDFEYEADHTKHSIGGRGGHIFRRAFHIGMAIIPWAYYQYGNTAADLVSLTPIQLIAAIGIISFIFELIRLKAGIVIVGQREYERYQFSAVAWGCLSIMLTFVALSPWDVPSGAHAGWLTIPIILSLTFGDPAMGEARRYKFDNKSVFLIGSSVCALTWILCGYFFGTPYWLALIMGPLTAASEWPKLKWIDDNATMVLLPLAAVLMFSPFL